jgi:hypothetical protein
MVATLPLSLVLDFFPALPLLHPSCLGPRSGPGRPGYGLGLGPALGGLGMGWTSVRPWVAWAWAWRARRGRD